MRITRLLSIYSLFAICLYWGTGHAGAVSFNCLKVTSHVERTICGDKGLSDLDDELAEEFRNARTAANSIQLLLQQKHWLRSLNRCSSSACLVELYRRRLAELRALGTQSGDNASPPTTTGAGGSVRGANEWDLPLLNGLPVLAADELNSEKVLFPFEPGANNADRSPHANWSRALYSTALANTPGVESTLSNQDAVHLACVFLSKSEQIEMFGQSACTFSDSLPGSEFALRDGGAYFRRTHVKRIAAKALHLPLKMLILIPVSLDKYDFTNAIFHLRYPVNFANGPVRVFGSRLDVLLPMSWPTSARVARQYVDTQRPNSHYRAWVAVTVLLQGVTAASGRSGMFESGAALADHRSWILQTEEAALFSGAGLNAPLYHFPLDPLRLAHPKINTVAKNVTSTTSPMLMSSELALLAIEGSQSTAQIQIDWNAAAQERYRFEQTFRNRPDWKKLDPWGVFFNEAPDGAAIEKYREWTIERSKAIPMAVRFRRLLSPYVATTQLNEFNTFEHSMQTVGGFNNRDYSTPGIDSDLARRMRARGIQESQIVPISMRLPGNDNVLVYAVLPGALVDYRLTLGMGAPQFVADGAQPTATIECEYSGVELFHYTAKGNRVAIVLKVVPKTVEFVQNGRSLAAISLPLRIWPAQPPPLASASDRLSGAPYGFDMLGLRLGMSIQEAKKLARAHFGNSRILETDRTNDLHSLGPPHGFMFLDEASKEAIAIFDWPPLARGRLVAAWHSIQVQRNTWSDVLRSSLSPMNGQPLVLGDHVAFWMRRVASEETTGNCLVGSGAGRWRWRENGRDVGLSSIAGETPETPRIAEDAKGVFEGCAPVFMAKSPQLMIGVTVPLVSEIYDLDVHALLARQSPQAASAAPAAPSQSLKWDGPAPADRLALGPYGPDVMGIRLGMSMVEAEQTVRNSMTVVGVVESKEPTEAGALSPQALFHAKSFIGNDRRKPQLSQQITLISAPPHAAGKVIAVSRSIYLDEGMSKQIGKDLTNKYGEPKTKNFRAEFWQRIMWASTSDCRVNDSERRLLGWAENPLFPGRMIEQVDVPVLPMPAPGRLSQFERCGPTVEALKGSRESDIDGVAIFRFRTRLFDPAVLTWLLMQHENEAPVAHPTARVKL